MSNHLAIATVTATLVQLLDRAISADVPGAQVTWVRPDDAGNGAPTAGVNLYLFQVTPNAAWRNADLPTRDLQGRLVQRPTVALDLHYLLTFYGDETKFEPQLILGSVVRALHDQPILTRDLIQDTLNANPSLEDSDLDEAVELVKFTPAALSLEELSKLWSVFFQIPYRLSTAYQGTVVLIESDKTPRAALPVRGRNIYGLPFRQPAIDSVEAGAGRGAALVDDSTLVIRGRHLRGEDTALRVGEVEVALDLGQVSERKIHLALAGPAFPAGELRAGVQGVQVLHRLHLGTPPVPHVGFESNVFPIVLHPTLDNLQVVAVQPAPADLPVPALQMDVAPRVGKDQRVVLLLNEKVDASPRAYTLTATEREADSDTLTIPIGGVEPGTYLVRVQVDGAPSLLAVAGDPDQPKFTGPEVTVP